MWLSSFFLWEDFFGRRIAYRARQKIFFWCDTAIRRPGNFNLSVFVVLYISYLICGYWVSGHILWWRVKKRDRVGGGFRRVSPRPFETVGEAQAWIRDKKGGV